MQMQLRALQLYSSSDEEGQEGDNNDDDDDDNEDGGNEDTENIELELFGYNVDNLYNAVQEN